MKKSLALFLGLFAQLSIFAQDAIPEGEIVQNNPGYSQVLIMIAIAILFFYFILWRPEQKRRKNMEKLRTSLSKGDKVTAMGIIGTVSKINTDTIVLKMIDGAKVEFLKAAISHVEPSSGNNSNEEKKVELVQDKS